MCILHAQQKKVMWDMEYDKQRYYIQIINNYSTVTLLCYFKHIYNMYVIGIHVFNGLIFI